MSDPTNYIVGQANPNPFNSLVQGYQFGNLIQQDQTQQQQGQIKLAQALQQQQYLNNLAGNPDSTAADYAKAMTALPGQSEGLARAWSVKNADQQQSYASDLGQWGYALASGNPQVASDAMMARADAMEQAAGGPTDKSQVLRANAHYALTNPKYVLGSIQAQLAANPNGEQAAKTLTALQTMAPNVKKAQADADLASTDASNAQQKADDAHANVRSEIADRANKFGLDTDKLNSEYQLKVAELRRKPGAVDLPDSAIKIVNDSAQNSVLANQTAAQMDDLANQFDTANPSSLAGGTAEALKNFTGQQNYLTRLRQEFARLKNSEALKALPPGSASDTDMRTVMGSFLSETASPKEISSFLRGLSRANRYNAQYEEAKSEWANSVGNLGRPSQDVQIGSTLVPAGTTFPSFVSKRLKPLGAQTQPAAPQNGVNYFLQRYGSGSAAPAVAAGAPGG